MTQNPLQGNNINKTVDDAVNQQIDNAAKRVPGGQQVEQTAKDKADQAINSELARGVGGVEKDAENLFNKGK